VVEHAYQYDARRNVSVELAAGEGPAARAVRDNGDAFTPGQVPVVDLDRHIASAAPAAWASPDAPLMDRWSTAATAGRTYWN